MLEGASCDLSEEPAVGVEPVALDVVGAAVMMIESAAALPLPTSA
jgi:hypothetical protein